jgi:C4-dicarboxylate-binding protein DctP
MRSAPCAFALLLAALLAVPPAHAQATLRLSLPISIDSPTGQNLREFARQVQARTGGALKIEFQAGHQRLKEHEVVSAVASGAIEIGAAPLGQLATDIPLCAAFLQPFLFNFDALIEAATKQEGEIRTLIEREILSRTKTRVLWWEPYGSSIIVSKRFPFNNPTAIATRRVGATDNQTRELLGICGGLPRSILSADADAELRKGTIEAAATDIMNVREADLWKVADTITNLRHAPSLFVVVINEDAWQRLAPEHREILIELAQDAQSYMWARVATIRAEAYAFALRKGMRVVELSANDLEAWRACSAPLMEEYIERAGDAGRRLFMAYGRLRTDPCCREPPAETPFTPQ